MKQKQVVHALSRLFRAVPWCGRSRERSPWADHRGRRGKTVSELEERGPEAPTTSGCCWWVGAPFSVRVGTRSLKIAYIYMHAIKTEDKKTVLSARRPSTLYSNVVIVSFADVSLCFFLRRTLTDLCELKLSPQLGCIAVRDFAVYFLFHNLIFWQHDFV